MKLAELPPEDHGEPQRASRILANNFADFPTPRSGGWLGQLPPGARVVALLLLGGVLGIAAYTWVMRPIDQPGGIPELAATTAPADGSQPDAAAPPADGTQPDAAATPADGTQPPLAAGVPPADGPLPPSAAGARPTPEALTVPAAATAPGGQSGPVGSTPPGDRTPPGDPTSPAAASLGETPEPVGPQIDISGLLGNEPVSQNWAGYAATAGGYTSVSATWNIPELVLNSAAGVDAAWVGIGGVRSRDLIQAGTQRTVSNNGVTKQEAWIEMLPRPSQTVPLAIGPGDSVTVSISQQGPETWLIDFTNTSSGQTFQQTEHYASSLSSVEWVAEAPSAGRGRPLPLDDFGTISFTAAQAVQDQQVVSIAQTGAHAITMITPGGLHLAEPSVLSDSGTSFNVMRTSTPSPQRRRS